MTKYSCYNCKTTRDLRPYGPNGSMTCFTCAFRNADVAKQTEDNFVSQLNAISGVVMLDGTDAGPYPAHHHPLFSDMIDTDAKVN